MSSRRFHIPETLLLKFSPDQLAVLDVNQDGTIDEADIEALQHLIIQHEHNEPITAASW